MERIIGSCSGGKPKTAYPGSDFEPDHRAQDQNHVKGGDWGPGSEGQ